MPSSRFRMTRTHLVLLIVFVSLSLAWQFVVERQPATSSPPSTIQNPAPATEAESEENHTLTEASNPANAEVRQGASQSVQQPEALRNSPADASPVIRPNAGIHSGIPRSLRLRNRPLPLLKSAGLLPSRRSRICRGRWFIEVILI